MATSKASRTTTRHVLRTSWSNGSTGSIASCWMRYFPRPLNTSWSLTSSVARAKAMPSREIVRKAIALCTRYAEYEYFFDHLSSASWLAPLAEEGMFRSPRPPEREGDYVRFPHCPESRYLA